MSSPAFYPTAWGDIGGFGIGSELMWQACGAVECHVSHSIFVEADDRRRYIDYRKDGLIYDVVTHGPQVTVEISF